MSADTPLLHSAACPCCAGRIDADPQAATALVTTIPGVSAYDIASVDLRALLMARSTVDGAGNYSDGLSRWNIDLVAGQELTIREAINSDIGMGTGVQLSYTFATSSADPGFRPMNALERTLVTEQLAKWAAVANITFTEVASNTGKTLSFQTYTFTVPDGTAVGLATGPSSVSYRESAGKLVEITFQPRAGDVSLDNEWSDRLQGGGTTPDEQSQIGAILLHEIGHGLGLSHPFGNSITLPTDYQVKLLTIMAYSDVNLYTYGFDAGGQALTIPRGSLGILDVLAIQKLYGANPNTNAGNDTYSWAETTAFRTTLYDAGGTDTIDLSGSAMRSSIDLTPNSLSSVNLRTTVAEKLVNTADIYKVPSNATNLYTGENNLGIVGTIENVRAGSGNDRINGNSVANEIWGGAGNDSVWGGAGDDRLFLGAGNDRVVAGSGNDFVDGGTGIDVSGLFGPRSSYSIVRQADGSLKVVGPEGSDTYANMEFLAFNDGGKVGLWLNADVKLGGGFDETFYLAKNPDVAAAVSQGWLSSGFAHWLSFGQAEGRTAIDARTDPLYDEVGYLAANSDVAAAVAGGGLRSGYDHYLAFGKSEGRTVTVLFDKDYYLSQNADVKAAGVDAFAHFMNYGWREGRDPSVYLDVSAYLDMNQDLRAADVNPLSHYLQYGQGEGRLLVAAGDLGLDWTYLG